MPAINANIVVEQTTLTLSPTTTQIGVTVDPINLTVYPAPPQILPNGTNGELQYKLSNSTFGGLANSNVSGGTLTFSNLANLKIAGGSSGYQLSTDGTGVLSWTDATSNANYANFANVANNLNATTTSNVVIGGGTNGYFLQTDGTGALTWNAGTTTPGSGNPGGANTQIQYNDAGGFGGQAGFTFNEVSGIVEMPTDLNVVNDITSTAGAFFGDGYGLSNIQPANIVGLSLNEIANGTSNVNISTVNGNVVVGVNGVADRLIITNIGLIGDGYGLSNVAVSSISNGTSNINISASSPEEIEFVVGGADVGSFVNIGASPYPGFLTVNGNVLAYRDIETVSGSLIGNGNGISNIQGANVSGAVSFATTANAVAGANVSGTVASATLATYATTANAVAGANVSGAVAFATTANAVAGANVSGAVSFATTANAVAGANVSGAVALATSATSANAVAGANVSGTVGNAAIANSVSASNVNFSNSSFAYMAEGAVVVNPFALGTYVWEIANKTFVDATDFPLTSDFNVEIWFPNKYIGTGDPLQIGQWMEITMLTKNTGTNTYTLNPNWTIRAAGTVNKYYYPANPTGNGYSGVQEWTWKVQRIADVGLNAAYNAIVTYKNLVT